MNSAPRKAFVIGHPIRHSRSPLIHGTWLETLRIEGSYEAIDVQPEALPAFFDKLRDGHWAGGNVTIPHKEAVFALCDEVDPLAQKIGAANTLVRRPDSTVWGTNTDYIGFLNNLDQNAPGWSENLGSAIVLGAGGASRAILVALIERGIKTIHLLNRTRDKAEHLSKALGTQIVPGDLTDFSKLAPEAGLVVNTTSIGMHGTRFEKLDLTLLHKSALVTDIVYTPLLTPLLADASSLGLKTVDGLGMLLHQAVPGFEAWFGARPTVDAALRWRVEATL